MALDLGEEGGEVGGGVTDPFDFHVETDFGPGEGFLLAVWINLLHIVSWVVKRLLNVIFY